MKEINIINAVVRKFGLTAEDVVKNWYANGDIHADFLQGLCGTAEVKQPFSEISFIPSKKFVTPKTIAPGMLYYADGLIFPELIKDNQVAAIIGCVNNNHGLATGLREAKLPWSSDYLFVDMASGLSGKEATEAILKAAKAQGKDAEAAEWCAAYAFDGINAGTMFLPSAGELRSIFTNNKKLRKAFSALKLQSVNEDPFSYYWSSSESGCYHDFYAQAINPSSCYINNENKKCRYLVRCVLAFQI